MKYIKSKTIYSFLVLLVMIVTFSCNKDVQQFPEPEPADTSSQPGLAAAIAADANYSLFSEVIKKSGYADTLNDKKRMLTLFVPTNPAVKTAVSFLTGGQVPSNAPDAVVAGFIQSAAFPVATANGLVKYNTIPQSLDLSALAGGSFNLQYPSMINPAPNLSALARLSVFLAKNNGVNYVNNVPVASARVAAGNGGYYGTAAVVMPPTRLLWQRISEAPDLTYLKAAVERADSGLTADDKKNPAKSMVTLLSSFGPSITLFAPTDDVFKATLYVLAYPAVHAAIYAEAKSQGAPDAVAKVIADTQAPGKTQELVGSAAVFSNPLLYPVLTAEKVKGLLAYHILGSTVFLSHFPAAETEIPTLLSLALGAAAPKLKVKATFNGGVATALTVKGAVNPTAAHVMYNPTPEPNGSSDQYYLNGTLHKIDQILLPLSF
ncbi:fasciclin domain-containing protein [Niabella beijingensis]|uniref:fasciclin domain-containing protein n=1 Tax=Niabella beijingensis TaxID=2872700 RepID=UPI001CBF6E39|nr:fasciclin domain-containing protein [Niabella beijingensis]MBZ4191149.1 fasciclin domain-containing protein [Niabella beijingensis]